MKRKTRMIIPAIIVILAGCATSAAARPVPVTRNADRCVTFDVTGRPKTGMPWDEPITFCAKGLPQGTWLCTAKSPVLNPGTKLTCTKEQ